MGGTGAVGNLFPWAGSSSDSTGVDGGDVLPSAGVRAGSGVAPHDTPTWPLASCVPLLHFEKAVTLKTCSGTEFPGRVSI